MREIRTTDFAIGIVLGIGAGLLSVSVVAAAAIYFLPQYFDVIGRQSPPSATNSMPAQKPQTPKS